MQCKKCGEVNDDRYKFCKKCGAPLTEEKAYCGFCGEEIESDADFCPFCGAYQDARGFRGYARTSDNVHATKDKKVRNVFAIVRAWVMAAIFALMFGLSFTSFIRVDISEYLEIETPIKVSAVNVLDAAFSKKQSAEEFIRNLIKKAESAKNEAAVVRAIEKANPLKLVFCKEMMEAASFTCNVKLITYTLLVLSLMLGSLTFAILFLIDAAMLTSRGKSIFKKDKAGLGLGIITAFGLFALSVTMGVVGAGPLSVALIGLGALILNTVYNAAVEKKKPASVKRFVAGCVSFALCMTMLFTANANMYAVKADVQIYSSGVYERSYIDTVKKEFSADDLFVGADLYSAKIKAESLKRKTSTNNTGAQIGMTTTDKTYIFLYLGDKDVFDIDDCFEDELYEEEIEALLLEIAPPNLFFYSEMSEGINLAGLMLGIFSFMANYLSGISLAVLLAFLMISLTDFKQKEKNDSLFALHCVSLLGITLMLIMGIICTGTSALIINQLSLSFKVVICAAPIINIVLALGMLIQYCILNAKRS